MALISEELVDNCWCQLRKLWEIINIVNYRFFLSALVDFLFFLPTMSNCLNNAQRGIKMVNQSNNSHYTNNQQQPEKLLRWPEVQARVGFCKSYSYVLQKKGIFPLPIKIIEGGRATGYLESEINEFINTRIEKSRRKVKS